MLDWGANWLDMGVDGFRFERQSKLSGSRQNCRDNPQRFQVWALPTGPSRGPASFSS